VDWGSEAAPHRGQPLLRRGRHGPGLRRRRVPRGVCLRLLRERRRDVPRDPGRARRTGRPDHAGCGPHPRCRCVGGGPAMPTIQLGRQARRLPRPPRHVAPRPAAPGGQAPALRRLRERHGAAELEQWRLPALHRGPPAGRRLRRHPCRAGCGRLRGAATPQAHLPALPPRRAAHRAPLADARQPEAAGGAQHVRPRAAPAVGHGAAGAGHRGSPVRPGGGRQGGFSLVRHRPPGAGAVDATSARVGFLARPARAGRNHHGGATALPERLRARAQGGGAARRPLPRRRGPHHRPPQCDQDGPRLRRLGGRTERDRRR